MNQRDAIAQWLAQWGQSRHLDLAFNSAGECAFKFEGVTAQVSVDEAGQTILYAALLAEQDVSANVEVLQALLRWAHLGGASHRCGVSLAPTGRPALWLWQDGAAQDAVQFTYSLSGFCIAASEARAQVAEAVGVEAESGAAIHSAELSMSGFLRG